MHVLDVRYFASKSQVLTPVKFKEEIYVSQFFYKISLSNLL